MYEKSMSSEERAEYETLLGEVFVNGRDVDRGMVYLFRKGLLDAVQAHRPWAAFILDDAQLAGLHQELKKRAQRVDVALVDYHGSLVGTSMRKGRRTRDDSGKSMFQQRLLQDFSWQELADWLDMINGQIQAALINKHVAQRLLDLREQFPDTYGPGDACGQLGTTVEDFLAQEAS